MRSSTASTGEGVRRHASSPQARHHAVLHHGKERDGYVHVAALDRQHAPGVQGARRPVGLLRDRGLTDKIKVIAYYFTPPVYEGIKAGTILAAPTDSAVIQGRIAIDQAVRILEGKDYMKHVGPALFVVTQENAKDFDTSSTLAPEGYSPVFRVE